jgi:hypothetical protein
MCVRRAVLHVRCQRLCAILCHLPALPVASLAAPRPGTIKTLSPRPPLCFTTTPAETQTCTRETALSSQAKANNPPSCVAKDHAHAQRRNAGAAHASASPPFETRTPQLTVLLHCGPSVLLLDELDLHVVHLCVPSFRDACEEIPEQAHGWLRRRRVW